MASGIDPKLTALIERLALKFSWLDPQYGIHAGQKPDQTVRVELGDGLIIVFSVRRDNWTANAIVFDGQDTFFGLVDGFEKELGTFSLKELRGNRGQLGLEIERDFYFTPCPLSTLLPWWRERLEQDAA